MSLLSQEQKFLLLRLKTATIPELFYRAKELILIEQLKRKSGNQSRKPFPIPKSLSLNKLEVPTLQYNLSKDDVLELLKGKTFTLNSSPVELIKIENEIGKEFFSNLVWKDKPFDVRIIWEPARLQNITSLLAVADNFRDKSLSRKIKLFCIDEILVWIKTNPFLSGPHYISVMECALRIPVLIYALNILDNLNARQIKIICKNIYLHAWWVSKRLSLYSSLGNHTVAESVGLIFAGAYFNHLKEAQKWFNCGVKILEKELKHQILNDGGPAEQSFHYHRFVLDLYWLAIDFLERNSLYECLNLKSRLIRAEKFLLAFQVQNEQLPSIGDDDGGFAIAPGINPKKPTIDYSKKKIRVFKSSGYTVITTGKRIQLTFDHGLLGMSPLYNHGHADALSITLNKDGRKVLVDSGTYKYNGEPRWRRYFKGTKAHNTITVDGLDQSIQETGFIWSHPYQVKILGFSEHKGQFLINAEHDGYTRLKEPVWHKRDLLFFFDSCFLIKDSFRGKGIHEFEINFHLHPGVDLIKQNSWWQIKHEEARIYIQLLENDDFMTIMGSMDPIHGWYSPHYGTKLKCNVMSCKKRGFPHEVSFMTAICTEALIDTKKIQDKLINFD